MLTGMLYFERGDWNLQQNGVFLDNVWMKSGVLMEVGSLLEAEAIARDMTVRFRHPNHDVVFKAKALPTDIAIQLVRHEFSVAGLGQASVEVNGNFHMQFLRDMAKRLVKNAKPSKARSFSLIIFANQVSKHHNDVNGISLDRIFFANH